MINKYFFLFLCLIFVWGCAHTARKKNSLETSQEIESALQGVTGALAGQNISDEDLRDLARDIQTNKETKAAVESISQSLGVQNSNVKYCPVDGKRFDASVNECPEHHVPLKNVE